MTFIFIAGYGTTKWLWNMGRDYIFLIASFIRKGGNVANLTGQTIILPAGVRIS